MKQYLIVLLCLFSLSAYSQETAKTTITPSKDQIKWMSFEEAIEASKKKKKKIFVDVYTEWCGWCKKMDISTFQDASVIKALNKNFYAVKLDAEQKGDIVFNEATFKWTPSGRKGTHQLAYALLDGRMGFPAFVMLDEDFNRIMISPGFKQVAELNTELKFSSSNAYKKKDFETYVTSKKKK